MYVLVAGDYVPNHSASKQIEKGDCSFLDGVTSIVKSVDYAIVNLESPVVLNNAKPIAKTGPNLKCSQKAMECIANAGFSCVTLANNHFRDYGQQGVEDTLISCKKYGVDYVGGGKSIDEANRILYKNIGGEKLAIINFCENEWSIATSTRGGSSPLNIINNFYAICEARKQADYVVVIVHGGIEHYQYPTPMMVERYRFFIDAGADAVVNHHQHCINGYEIYKGKPIFYGLGNVFFPWEGTRPNTWNYGYMVCLNLNKDIGFELIPYKQIKEGIVLQDKTEFDKEIEPLSSSIKSPTFLQQKFDEHIESKKVEIINSFLPSYMRTRVFFFLLKHGLFKDLYRRKHLFSIKNRLICESYQESTQRLFVLLVEKTQK